MKLNFTKKNYVYAAYFKVNADFNLHIEGVSEDNVRIGQRGTENGKYAQVQSAVKYPTHDKVYDFDHSALVYPKYIRVECDINPTMAEVTSNGEVTEITE